LIAQNVALAVHKQGSALIHISTDHLFSGRQSFCSEDEPLAPLNYYATTKSLAESAVTKANHSALILRTNFFGWGHASRQSFTDWIIYSLRLNRELALFDNVFFTPILVDFLAIAAHELVEKGVTGVFNLVGEQRLSKYQFATILADKFLLPKHLLQPHSFNGSQLIAPRPKDMSLCNLKVRNALGREIGDVANFLTSLQELEISGRSAELLKSVTQG
jgi:dTDP-4-dehydrorhamnose reductase